MSVRSTKQLTARHARKTQLFQRERPCKLCDSKSILTPPVYFPFLFMPKVKMNKNNKRKLISLQCKLDVIKRYERGESKAHIGRELRLNESSVRTILLRADEYRETASVASTASKFLNTRNRHRILVEMECILFNWLEECNQKGTPMNSKDIMAKALDVFSELKKNKYQQVDITFAASRGWYENFKYRMRNVSIF